MSPFPLCGLMYLAEEPPYNMPIPYHSVTTRVFSSHGSRATTVWCKDCTQGAGIAPRDWKQQDVSCTLIIPETTAASIGKGVVTAPNACGAIRASPMERLAWGDSAFSRQKSIFYATLYFMVYDSERMTPGTCMRDRLCVDQGIESWHERLFDTAA